MLVRRADEVLRDRFGYAGDNDVTERFVGVIKWVRIRNKVSERLSSKYY